MNYLIFGASSGIAQGIINCLLERNETKTITEQWRNPPATAIEGSQIVRQRVITDPSGEMADLSACFNPIPDVVINCIGMLHEEKNEENQQTNIQPEKCLEQLQDNALLRMLQINTLVNIHIAQAITKYSPKKHAIKFIALSALVGSITENQLGGWYSYRMSKAALNMFMRTLSIEWHRRLPKACCAAVHPGTTETYLSHAFLKNHPANKLYSTETTAQRMLAIADDLSVEQSGKLLMWDGSEINY